MNPTQCGASDHQIHNPHHIYNNQASTAKNKQINGEKPTEDRTPPKKRTKHNQNQFDKQRTKTQQPSKSKLTKGIINNLARQIKFNLTEQNKLTRSINHQASTPTLTNTTF